jgi:hypothetical protein
MVVIASCFTVSAFGAKGGAPCRLERLAVVPISTNADDSLLVTLIVNGTPAQFALTGADASFIYAEDADRLGLSHGHVDNDIAVWDGDQRVTDRWTGKVLVGNFAWEKFGFLPMRGQKPPGSSIAGEIGLDLFDGAGVDVDLNLAGGELDVVAPGTCPAPQWAGNQPLPLSSWLGVTFSARLNGKDMGAQIVLSSDVSSVTVDTARRLGFAEDTPGVSAITTPDPFWLDRDRLRFTASTLTVGSATLNGLTVDAVDPHLGVDKEKHLSNEVSALYPYEQTHGYHPYSQGVQVEQGLGVGNFDFLWLGRAELRKLRLYFKFSTRELYVAPATAPVTN